MDSGSLVIRLDFDTFILNDAESSGWVAVREPNLSAHGQCLVDKFQVRKRLQYGTYI